MVLGYPLGRVNNLTYVTVETRLNSHTRRVETQLECMHYKSKSSSAARAAETLVCDGAPFAGMLDPGPKKVKAPRKSTSSPQRQLIKPIMPSTLHRNCYMNRKQYGINKH